MALPVIAVGVLARFLVKRGGMALAKAYAKKNKKRITQSVITKAKNLNKTPKKPTKNVVTTKANLAKKTSKVSNAVKARGGGAAKVKSNKSATQPSINLANARKMALLKNKPKHLLTKADKVLLATVATVPFLLGPSKKKTETKKTGRTTSP